jgi:hypothetical protein
MTKSVNLSALEIVRQQKRQGDPPREFGDEDIDVALAWARDEISAEQINRAKSFSGSNSRYWLAAVLKTAIKRGRLIPTTVTRGGK